MICKTCGRVLSDADSFCPTCGATVESRPEQEEVVFHAPKRDFEWDIHSFPGEAPTPTEDTNFDWGISANVFRRRPEVEQKQPQQTVTVQQPAQPQGQQAGENTAPQQQLNQQVQQLDQQGQQPAQQVQQPAQPAQPRELTTEETKKAKSGFFARFKDRKMTVEQPVITDEMIAEAQSEKLEAQKQELRAAAVQQEAMQTPTQPTSPTKKEHVEFDWSQPAPQVAPAQQPRFEQAQAIEKQTSQQDEKKTQQIRSSSVPEAVFTQNELKAERPGDITGEALERELFGGAAVTGMVDGGEGLSRQTARIDQFYTFNRKNEEFQKLLDDEYDKFRAGKPLDSSTFAANVEAIRERDLDRMIPRVDGPEVAFDNRQTSVFKPISHEPVAVDEDYEDPDKKAAVAAMTIASSPVIADEEKIREMFGTSTGDKAAEKQTDRQTEEQAKQKAKEEAAEQKRLKKEAKEKAKREKKEQKAKAKAEKAQAGKASSDSAAGAAGTTDVTRTAAVARTGAEPPANAGEAAQKAEKKEEQQSKVGKIVIIILSVILALLVIALGLKIIAPDSILSQKIDNIADSVMTVFIGDEEEQEPAGVDDESREDFNSDLTGVIRESVDDNFNNLIAQVSYDSELTYEKKKNKYKDNDLKNSVPITDNVWYEQEDGKKLYLDEAIVKNVVRFESQWQSMIREGREAVLSLVDEDTKLYEEVDNSFETNPTSEFKQLDIGEIRRGENNNYYVWVRETKDDSVKEKVYKIIDDRKNMQFVGYTQL